MSITPQAGMPVVYHPQASDAFTAGSTPLAAQIVYVWSDTMVNLVVWDMYGEPHKLSSVHLNVPQGMGRWCEFPGWLINAVNPPVPVDLIRFGGRQSSFGEVAPSVVSAFGRDVAAAMVPPGTPERVLCACGRSQALCEIVGLCKNKAA